MSCAHKVCHDAELVEGGLPVEEDDITVYQMALHHVPILHARME